MGTPNKKLEVPEIHLDKFTLSKRDTCWIGKIDLEDINCQNTWCDNCIFNDSNIHAGLLYLISKGYITKEEAMQVALDG